MSPASELAANKKALTSTTTQGYRTGKMKLASDNRLCYVLIGRAKATAYRAQLHRWIEIHLTMYITYVMFETPQLNIRISRRVYVSSLVGLMLPALPINIDVVCLMACIGDRGI